MNERAEDDRLLRIENVQVDESDVASPFVPVLEKVTCDETGSEIDLGSSSKCENALTYVDEHCLVNLDTSGQADVSLSVPHIETDLPGCDVSEKLMQDVSSY